jgi:hypothetical protein
MWKLIGLVAAIALLGESAALAETCKVRNHRAPGDWVFVHVHDADTGQIVLRQAINGGDSKNVTVSGHRARVDQKPAGYRQYKTGSIAVCKGGNTISF